MFSKFKKVLVSLALASSLALAPMNVSAVNLTQSDSSGKTSVYARGSQFVAKYTVEVPEAVRIDLDDKKCDADYLSISLKESEDFGGDSLKVTPNFSLLSESGAKVTVKYGEDNEGSPIQGEVGLSEIFKSNDLLKFGTLENGEIKEGSSVATFAENEKNSAKDVGLIVDETQAMNARKAIPDYNGVFADTDKKCDPTILDDQQIGTITYTCSFVSNS